MSDVRIELDTKLLDKIIRATGEIREDAVRDAALAVEANAKHQVQVLGAIDTGTLRNSIYMSDDQMPDIQSRSYSRKQKRVVNAGERRVSLPKSKDGRSETVKYVGPSVEYGIYVEMGTTKMAARPYLGNAIRGVKRQLEKQLKRLENAK